MCTITDLNAHISNGFFLSYALFWRTVTFASEAQTVTTAPHGHNIKSTPKKDLKHNSGR